MHDAQIAMFQKRMGLLPEFKLSKKQAEKAPSETSQEPGPHEESMDVGGSDAENTIVPLEGDGLVHPKMSGTEMLLPTEQVKKSRKSKKRNKKEA